MGSGKTLIVCKRIRDWLYDTSRKEFFSKNNGVFLNLNALDQRRNQFDITKNLNTNLKHSRKVLIIVPREVLDQWKECIFSVLFDHLKCIRVVLYFKRLEDILRFSNDDEILIILLPMKVALLTVNLIKLKKYHFDLIFLDESHLVDSCSDLEKCSNFLWMITATAEDNSLATPLIRDLDLFLFKKEIATQANLMTIVNNCHFQFPSGFSHTFDPDDFYADTFSKCCSIYRKRNLHHLHFNNCNINKYDLAVSQLHDFLMYIQPQNSTNFSKFAFDKYLVNSILDNIQIPIISGNEVENYLPPIEEEVIFFAVNEIKDILVLDYIRNLNDFYLSENLKELMINNLDKKKKEEEELVENRFKSTHQLDLFNKQLNSIQDKYKEYFLRLEDSCNICLSDEKSNCLLSECCRQKFCFDCLQTSFEFLGKNDLACPLCRQVPCISSKYLNELTNKIPIKNCGEHELKNFKITFKNLLVKCVDNFKKIVVAFDSVDLGNKSIFEIFPLKTCVIRKNSIREFRNILHIFRHDSEKQILFLNSTICNFGINLEFVDCLIFLNEFASQDAFKQMIGRAQRFGRTEPLKIFYFKNA